MKDFGMISRLLVGTAARLAMMLAIVLGGATAGTAADTYFGAISFSPSSGASGWGYDFRSSDDAAEAALRNCGRYAEDCELITWFKNGCGALAANSDAFVGAWSNSKDDAQRRAMQRCNISGRGCAIVRWVCTTNSQW
jgi:serine/threonine-protein kinase